MEWFPLMSLKGTFIIQFDFLKIAILLRCFLIKFNCLVPHIQFVRNRWAQVHKKSLLELSKCDIPWPKITITLFWDMMSLSGNCSKNLNKEKKREILKTFLQYFTKTPHYNVWFVCWFVMEEEEIDGKMSFNKPFLLWNLYENRWLDSLQNISLAFRWQLI